MARELCDHHPPQLRAHFEKAGWSKKDIRKYVFEHARIQRKEWADCGKASVVGSQGEQEYAALTDEDDLLVIAAGGPAGGFGAVSYTHLTLPTNTPV